MASETGNSLFLEELFDDVGLMVARARKHKAEFAEVIARESWWSIEEGRTASGAFSNTLVIRCQQLKELKPIAADLCNNLVHALDQMIGALTRANGRDNSERLQFPWQADQAKFERSLSRIEKSIGRDAADCIRGARDECRLALPAAHLAKVVSNSGKHWELVPSTASIPAIAVHRPGAQQQIFNLPPNALEEHLHYTFYEGPDRLRQFPMTVLIGLNFSGLSDDLVSPNAVFGSAFHYVETVVRSVSESKAVSEMAANSFGG